MHPDLIEKIERTFTVHPGLRGCPATDEEIDTAENRLNVEFSAQYIEFIRLFGGAFGGISIHAFKNASLVGKATVVELTEKFRKTYGYGLHELPDDAYVISDDGCGNNILIHNTERLFIFLHETHEVDVLYNSLEELLLKSFP